MNRITETSAQGLGPAESPDLVIAKRLLDHLKLRGFSFHRAAPGPDGLLVGNRVSRSWVEVVHLAGFGRGCAAWRHRRSPLIVPGSGLVDRWVQGSALAVLNDVLTWNTEP